MKKYLMLAMVLLWALPVQAGIIIVQQTINQIAPLQLVSSTPASEASLAQPPKSIALTFSQAVNADASSITLYDPYNAPIITGDIKGSDNTLSVSLPPFANGYSGRYRVEWKATCQCADKHVVSGSFHFNIQ